MSSVAATLLTLKKYRIQPKRTISQGPIEMNRVAAVILGGGEGTRLMPLTSTRCKPAIGFGGKYRLIDVPMSNAIHSGCSDIFVITQYLSASLHEHLFKTYQVGNNGFQISVRVLTPEQRPSEKIWFKGTADAIRQNLEYLVETNSEYILILSGDQLYNLDFRKMMQTAKETDADLVIASLAIAETDAKRLGVLKIDQEKAIIDFYEKPQTEELLSPLKMSEEQIDRFSINPGSNKRYLASMGIYLFKKEALIKLLQQDSREDFGKHLIPTKVGQGKVFAYVHQDYWEDIGTISSFYQANMDLLGNDPLFKCPENMAILATHSHLNGAKIHDTQLTHSIICEGSIIEAREVSHSILGTRSVIKKGTIIRNSYLMSNDAYIRPQHKDDLPDRFEIGENCIINRAIIDEHVHIGNGVQLINKQNLATYTDKNVYIRDGVIIVPRGASIPDHFIL